MRKTYANMSIFAEGSEYILSKTSSTGHANPDRYRAATSRARCAKCQKRTCVTKFLPHRAPPGEPLVVKPQDSLTNTEERSTCHGMTAKFVKHLSLPNHLQPCSWRSGDLTLPKVSPKKGCFHSSAKVVLIAMDNPWLSQE